MTDVRPALLDAVAIDLLTALTEAVHDGEQGFLDYIASDYAVVPGMTPDVIRDVLERDVDSSGATVLPYDVLQHLAPFMRTDTVYSEEYSVVLSEELTGAIFRKLYKEPSDIDSACDRLRWLMGLHDNPPVVSWSPEALVVAVEKYVEDRRAAGKLWDLSFNLAYHL